LAHFKDVHFTHSGSVALGIIENQPVDVVISDFFLHEMDGIEFRKFMAAKTTDPFFLLLTAAASDPKIRQRLEIDQFLVMQKPPHPDELVLKLRSWLKPKQKRKAA